MAIARYFLPMPANLSVATVVVQRRGAIVSGAQEAVNTVPSASSRPTRGNTVLSVILNLQVRVQELETKLRSLGILT